MPPKKNMIMGSFYSQSDINARMNLAAFIIDPPSPQTGNGMQL